MKIKSLEINNFLVIGTANVNLDARGLILVQGINNDDSSANSNGAGKSSIVDAISWCLYGETARGVSGDEVVNDKVKKGCSVKIVVEDAGHQYAIERYRKDKDHKNDLLVFDAETAEELTKGTTQLTQELVNKIVGCSHDVFVASVYSGQEKMPDLPGMTDKQLKLVVEEAAGIERLQAASDIAAVKNRVAQSEVDRLNVELEKNKTAMHIAESEIHNLSVKSGEYEQGKIDEIDALTKSLKGLNESRGELAEPLSPAKEAKIKVEMAAIKQDIEESQGEEKRQLAKLIAEITECEKTLSATNVKLTMAMADSKKAKAEMDGVESRVGTPCTECGKEYCEDDIQAAKKNAQEKLRVALLNLRQQKEAKEHAEKQLTIAQKRRSDFEAALTDVSELLKRYSDFEKRLQVSQQNKKAHDDLSSNISQIQSKIEAAQKAIEDNPYPKMIDGKREDVRKMNEYKESVTANLLEAEARLEVTKAAVDVFGRAGVRAHILDTVTPFLNERTAEYLGTLTDGNITASWSTLGKTTKGELREKFGITSEKMNGSKSFKGLSGGEKRKVRLSTSMALQDLVASRATKPIEFMLFDEIDDALDASGLERLMTILEKRGREKGTVLVISHNDLAMWINEGITVKNTGGISEVIDF